jgi:3-dehydroquinate synthase
METITVELGPRSYPIHIGTGLLDDATLLAGVVPALQVMVVSNTVVAPLYLDRLLRSLGPRTLRHVVLPDGENHKNLGTLEHVISALIDAQFDRDCMLVALGGGVVGDVTGFAAACYQRGVDFVQVPTTLLAQVDSSVGGKTAVNHPRGKNMIGAFHQPRAVIIDANLLMTLPPREVSAGVAEIVKYGLIRDAAFFAWLERDMDALVSGDAAARMRAIERSCRIKAAVIGADERESGDRALLNLGHTFGHAIEAALQYRDWLHGEAVAAGMCMAAQLSARLGCLAAADVARVEALVTRAGLPTRAPAQLTPEVLLQYMAIDKKARAGRLRLVLLDAIGTARVRTDYPPEALQEVLQTCRARWTRP